MRASRGLREGGKCAVCAARICARSACSRLPAMCSQAAWARKPSAIPATSCVLSGRFSSSSSVNLTISSKAGFVNETPDACFPCATVGLCRVQLAITGCANSSAAIISNTAGSITCSAAVELGSKIARQGIVDARRFKLPDQIVIETILAGQLMSGRNLPVVCQRALKAPTSKVKRRF